jgi:thiamine-monophosphate kinase
VTEADFLALLRPFATDPAARGLLDDAAVLGDLVLTHDLLVEGVHFLSDDPPEDVAWKLIAVNLSDLAAKGAKPLGVLLGYPLSNGDWDAAFVRGLGEALAEFDVPLLGGDTVKGPRVLSLTAIGRAETAPSRSGAQAGDKLWVTGMIGRAGLGLQGNSDHITHYRRPTPRLTEGQALAPLVHAMMDVSDGLLIDAQRMAFASSLALEIDLDAVPVAGDRLAAVTAGDDYELLFAAAPGFEPPVAATCIGIFASGSGLTLRDTTGAVPLPERLGWQHGQ